MSRFVPGSRAEFETTADGSKAGLKTGGGHQTLMFQGTSFDLDTSTTSGIVWPSLQFLVQQYQPSGAIADVVRFTGIRRYEYKSAQDNSGVGHFVAGVDWYVHQGSGDPMLAIAHEAKVDNEDEDSEITKVIVSDRQVSSNEGSIATVIGGVSRITGNAGTIDTFVGDTVELGTFDGDVTNVIGTEFPDLEGKADSRIAYVNRDPKAPMLSAAPMVDQSVTYASPEETAFTVAIPAFKQILLLTPADTYAAGTIQFPPKASVYDCQVVEITTSHAVTAVTWDANGAGYVLNAPAGLTAGQTVRFRYFAAIDWWVRI